MSKHHLIVIVAVTGISFSTMGLTDTTLSQSDLSTCKMYLDQIAARSTMTETEKKQANAALKNCLGNAHPTICSTKPLSSTPNCTNVQSNIDLFGEAISTAQPAVEANTAPPTASITNPTPTPTPVAPAKLNPPPPPKVMQPTAAPTPPASQPSKSSNTDNSPYSYF